MPAYVPVRARKHRYRQFAAKYIKNGCNGLQTVIDCGFTDNPDSAKVIASRLLTYDYVDNQIKKIQTAADVTAERVTKEIADVAFSDVKISEAGKMKALESLTSILGMKKGEIPQKPEEDSKSFIAKLIADLVTEEGRDPYEVELSLQTQFAKQFNFDGSPRRRYDPDADPTLAPECWPSGNLLSKPEKIRLK